MAAAILRLSSPGGRKAVAGWFSGGIAILLTALLGVAPAAQIRLAAAFIGQAWSWPTRPVGQG